MTDQKDGGCRCGRVRFRVSGPPMVTMACHCRGCQRMTASAFSVSALYAGDKFAVTQGETAPGGTGEMLDHRFCPDCKSWMFTRFETGMVNVRSTLLDDPSGTAPFIQCCVPEGLPWARTGAVHGFDVFPDPGDCPRLVAEYASWPGRSA